MNILIVGFGSMGKLHGKYLDEIGVKWSWFDPYSKDVSIKRVNSIEDVSSFSHVIIATPTTFHKKYLEKFINEFEGKVFVEKPGVMSESDLGLLSNKRVSVGMVERFNPGFISLKNAMNPKNVLCIDFIRCSALPVSRIEVNSFVDVGIHDLDLLMNMFPKLEIQETSCFRNQNTFALNLKFNNNKIARFMWSNETFHKDRKIHVRQKDYNLTCNLSDQTVKKYYLSENYENIVKEVYVEKKSSILSELEYFLGQGNRIDAFNSHVLFLKMLEKNEDLRRNGA